MNKQLIFIIIAALGGLGIVGVFVLLLIRPDATATLISFLFQLLAMLAAFGGLAYVQGKEIETIKSNTNGTLTRRDEEIAALRAKLAAHAPQALVEVTETGPITIKENP